MHEPSLLIAALGGNIKPRSGGWIAKCPVHNDKDFAMLVGSNGTGFNIKCLACGANGLDVYRHLGLDLGELTGKEMEEQSIPSKILKVFDFESYFIEFYCRSVANGVVPTWQDKKRLKLAKSRITGILNKY